MEGMTKKCCRCGKAFELKKWYCSVNCRRQAWKRRNEASIRCRQSIRRRTLFTLADRFGWKCWYCQKPLQLDAVHLDHILAKANGGTDEISNLALTCGFCNRAKTDLDVDEFVGWLDWVRNGNSKTLLDDKGYMWDLRKEIQKESSLATIL